MSNEPYNKAPPSAGPAQIERGRRIKFAADSSYAWRSLYLLGHFLKLFFCTLQIEGLHNIPAKGGVVYACNHSLGPDYVVLGWASPRQVYFMAKSELFSVSPLLTRLLLSIGTFPIQRGRHDASAMASAVEIVRSGKALGMFPEGTRSRTNQLQPARPGAVRIAMAAGVPILPAAVINSEQMFPRRWLPWTRPLVIMRYGEPFMPEGEPDDPAAVQRNTDRMMHAIAALLPPERRGVYADPAATHDVTGALKQAASQGDHTIATLDRPEDLPVDESTATRVDIVL